ncbi:Crinkler (CRN) family protein [Thraustotheca clavata]|uniref:Crinkler (CRN) family protein n=1 Tax=Thraustotheca clavata TaxID=74557 RepID=A0A1W0A2Q4_9STRA|nr:Crinkler (CRN) family protein [Thraustotheca clavata]
MILNCVVLGKGRPFPIEIDADKTVGILKDKIKEKKPNAIRCDADELELYCVDGLTQNVQGLFDFNGSTVHDLSAKLLNDFSGSTTKMVETFPLSSYLQLSDSSVGRIHVLVTVSADTLAPSVFWVVNGSVENALDVKGVRSRLYRLADLNLGYYDPNHPDAFVYEGNKLMLHILFETKENALIFDTKFRDERITIGSPLNNLTILSNVNHASRPSNEFNLRRINYEDYNPRDSDSPQETMSQISSSSISFAINELKESSFGFMGKAERAHLMSKQHCEKYSSCKKYKADKNNILALSHTMHGYFEALDREIPLFKIDVGSVEDQPVDGTYKVILKVTALNHECKDDVFGRLKDGYGRTDDPLTVTTYVYVENPQTFCHCLKWKCNEIQKCWDSYFSLDSAVA